MEVIGVFADEDRTAVLCNDCRVHAEENGKAPEACDPITYGWDGAESFRCERCGRLLVEVR